MSTLVKTTENLKTYVAVNMNFSIDNILPYIRRKERKHIKSVIGDALYASWIATAPATGKAKEVFELLQEASANLATFDYTFIGGVQMTGAGITVSTNANSAAADWWRIRDLRRDLLKAGNEAIDEALAIMEANEADFPEWTSTPGYTNFKKFFIRKTETFQEHFNINNSRLTFLRLRPHLLKVEDKFFTGLLGQETVDVIKAAADAPAKEALKICQAAQAALCISELAYEGAFTVTPQGIFTELEEIPGEKKTPVDNNAIFNLHLAKQTQGNELLKNLITVLEENPDTFPAFAERPKNSPTPTTYNTGSTVSF